MYLEIESANLLAVGDALVWICRVLENHRCFRLEQAGITIRDCVSGGRGKMAVPCVMTREELIDKRYCNLSLPRHEPGRIQVVENASWHNCLYGQNTNAAILVFMFQCLSQHCAFAKEAPNCLCISGAAAKRLPSMASWHVPVAWYLYLYCDDLSRLIQAAAM